MTPSGLSILLRFWVRHGRKHRLSGYWAFGPADLRPLTAGRSVHHRGSARRREY